jgi:hypothetical protein
LIDPGRQESMTAAAVVTTTAAASAYRTPSMEQTRLDEEKLRIQTKDKKNQSKLFS